MSIYSPPLTPDFTKTSPSEQQKSVLSSSITRNDLPTPPYTPEWRNSRASSTSPLSPYTNRLSIDSSCFQSVKNESKRLLTQNELSYYLPARGDGVNDMYLHHNLSAPCSLMSPSRLLHIWALQILRHPLLASRIKSSSSSYTDTSFIYTRPSTLESALEVAQTNFSYTCLPQDMVDHYLNGPRTLSNDRLGMLQIKGPSFIGHPDYPTQDPFSHSHHSSDSSEISKHGEDSLESYEIMLCATHFLGDGMALHTFMNEFYTLLGSKENSIETLSKLIETELLNPQLLPLGLEDRLPQVGNGTKLSSLIAQEEFKRSESKLVGGQSFTGNRKKMERKTVVPTFAYSEAETKKILANCKKNGVTIAHAVFALCNLAWARRSSDRIDPTLIYSALNLRANMLPLAPSSSATSFFHLAVGYFNIILPTLLPSTLTTSELFWHRARMTKSQTMKAVKSPFVVARSRESSNLRSGRAVKWAAVDDAEEEAKRVSQANAGLGLSLEIPTRQNPQPEVSTLVKETNPKIAPVRAFESTPATPPTPSKIQEASERKISQKALMGVSMLGNLDGMYKHATFGELRLEGLMTGSRQRPGGLLLFAYTFTGKLWLSLGYDMNGFESGAIEGFWEEVQALVKEVLL